MWDEPFEFFGGRRRGEAEGLHQWGGWRVREKYPSLFAWRAPPTWSRVLWSGDDQRRDPGGYRLRHQGVVRCPACHRVARHRLRWPADAYFQWSIRGQTLWAWNAGDARVLLHYVESTLRAPERYPGHAKSLRELPAVFLTARNRGLVARRIRATLAEITPRE